MQWTIPGTTLVGDRDHADQISDQFDALFLAGALTLSQVATIAGTENHVIQNWVKRGFLPPPVNKRYSMEQLCRILNINLLRGILPIDQVLVLMRYLNGDLVDESDDLVDDTQLYFYFVRLAAKCQYIGGDAWEDALSFVTADYQESVIGARTKLRKVLNIMLTVWVANCLKSKVDIMLTELTSEPTEL